MIVTSKMEFSGISLEARAEGGPAAARINIAILGGRMYTHTYTRWIAFQVTLYNIHVMIAPQKRYIYIIMFTRN